VVQGSSSWDDPPALSEKTDGERVLARLSQLVGGTWINSNPDFKVELRYEWAFHRKAIRGLAVIGKGGPREQQAEAILGIDPVEKTVYYLDCHGGNQVFTGVVKQDGNDLIFEFASVIGPAGKWREVLRFPGRDAMEFTVFGEKEGKSVAVVQLSLTRTQPTCGPGQLVTEGVVDAPVDAVWAALTTKEGQESWNVAHAEIDLAVGGKMLTHYDPKGKIGDPNTIENLILSFEPKRMLSMRVGNPPKNFPFKEAIKKVWTVIHFDDAGPGRTRLRVVGVGYGDDEESKKLRDFFDKGNSYTLKKLQEKFAARPASSTSKVESASAN
jgi:uncharacterized protein YndB with AHSA1/START domain